MQLVVVTPPKPVVSLDDAKAHLRVEHDDDDDLIEGLIAAATASLDGPDGWLGRALGDQVLELSTSPAIWTVALPCPPVVSIEEVSTLDAAGTAQILDPSLYRLESGGLVRSVSATGGPSHWPGCWARSDGLRIRYRAGYPAVTADDGTTLQTLPAPIRQAILMMVARLYAARGEMIAGATEDPAIAALLAPFRVWA